MPPHEEFLSGRGLGNEIPFYAFDYPPEDELAVREHVAFLLAQIPKKRPDLHVFTFALLGAFASHIFAGDPLILATAPLVILGLMAGAYVLDKQNQ